MKEVLPTVGSILGPAGFPANIFMYLGIGLGIWAMKQGPDVGLLLCGAGVFFFGLMSYYGGRFRGYSMYVGERGPFIGDWPAFWLFVFWLVCSATCAYLAAAHYGVVPKWLADVMHRITA